MNYYREEAAFNGNHGGIDRWNAHWIYARILKTSEVLTKTEYFTLLLKSKCALANFIN